MLVRHLNSRGEERRGQGTTQKHGIQAFTQHSATSPPHGGWMESTGVRDGC